MYYLEDFKTCFQDYTQKYAYITLADVLYVGYELSVDAMAGVKVYRSPEVTPVARACPYVKRHPRRSRPSQWESTWLTGKISNYSKVDGWHRLRPMSSKW